MSRSRWHLRRTKRCSKSLREDLALTGTKHGCELGECGCCAVLVDGQPVLSCLVLGLAVEGREVSTVEGMADGAALHPLQQAFAELGAAQCGYCTPGILLTAQALLEKTPRPSRDEIKEALAGNICRCTGYIKIYEAVELAAARMAGEHGRTRKGERIWADNNGSGRNGQRARVERRREALPQGRFGRQGHRQSPSIADDMVLPRMLYTKLLRSTVPHARIVKIDTSKAEISRASRPCSPEKISRSLTAFCPSARTNTRSRSDKVRMVGDPVAAIAALDEDIATGSDRPDRGRVRAAALHLVHPGGARQSRHRASTTMAKAATFTGGSPTNSATWRPGSPKPISSAKTSPFTKATRI